MQFIEKAEKPEVIFVSNGTILPNSKGLVVPFRAISLYAVDVSVVRIFENNVLMFLQDNSLESSSELRRSGRLVYRKMLRLGNEQNVTEWGNYSVDLSELIAQEPGAIYRVMLSFRQEYSAYPCGDDDALPSGGGPCWINLNLSKEKSIKNLMILTGTYLVPIIIWSMKTMTGGCMTGTKETIPATLLTT